MKKVFFICNSSLQLEFAFRLHDAFIDLGYFPVYYTTKLSVLISRLGKSVGCKSLFNKNEYKNACSIDASWKNLITGSVEYKSSVVSYKRAVHDFSRIYNAFLCEASRETPSFIFLWMPWSYLSKAVTASVPKFYDCKTIYVEISNFPERTVFDYRGINASSTLSEYPDLIKKVKLHFSEAKQWLDLVDDMKVRSVWPPQSRSSKNIQVAPVIDYIAGLLKIAPSVKTSGLIKRALNKLLLKSTLFKYNYSNVVGKFNFIFYPMQVTTDSQLLINSCYNNWDALEIALRKARNHNCFLVVKPHPAEINVSVILKLNNFSKINEDVAISNSGTRQLIELCSEVVTVNSTVGQEAILMNKKVTVLGDAFYKSFTKSDMLAYVYSWLEPIDVFSVDKVPSKILESSLLSLRHKENLIDSRSL